MIDRVDHLRNTTGVDVAARPPGGSDWTDEDDDMVIPPTSRQQSGTSPMASAGGEDGMSFSGRDLRKDMQRAFGGMATGGGGSYGMGSSSGLGFGSGSYGFGSGSGGSIRSRAPKSAGGVPNYAAPSAPSATPLAGMGLTQQVAALENEIFGKTYGKDTLPGRLVRLETTVFPSDKTAAQKALPERVNRLVAAVPISKPLASVPQPAHRRAKDPDFDDDDEDMKLPTVAPQRSLGSLMNQMNSLMSNSNFAGGYQVPAGNMATDPSTGLLIDRTTGNLIDPTTGMVIGRRVAPSPYAVPPVYGGVPAYGGGLVMPPFNSGFSPNYGGSVNYGVRNPAAGMRGMGVWP